MDLDTGLVIIRDTVRDTTVILQHKTVVLTHKTVMVEQARGESIALAWILACILITIVVSLFIKWGIERYKERKKEDEEDIAHAKHRAALTKYWESDEYRIEQEERLQREQEERWEEAQWEEAQEDAYTDRVVKDCSLMMYNI